MAVICWKTCYEVGVSTFDEEHHTLVQVINDLYEAIREKRGDAALQELLATLVEYTKKHFDHEEVHMEKHNYPEIDEHKKEHVILKDKLVDYQQKISDDTVGLTPEIMGFLRAWLLDHIVDTDKQFGQFLQDNSVYDCGPPAV